MAAKKSAAKRSPVPAPMVVPGAGEPVGRWAQILAESQGSGVAIEPFQITETLTLQPLTPRRAKKLGAAQQSYLTALAAVANAQRFGATQAEVDDLQERIDAALTAYNEALVGETEYPAVEAHFADRPAWQQELFLTEVKRQFLRLPDDDGTCPTCTHNHFDLDGRVQKLEAALREHQPDHPLLGGEPVGKGNGSSTTSSTTGISSPPTSPPNCTESTPGTGAEERDPGHSSSSTPTLLPT